LKLTGGVWHPCDGRSRPARGAWIETFPVMSGLLRAEVAPRAGRVD